MNKNNKNNVLSHLFEREDLVSLNSEVPEPICVISSNPLRQPDKVVYVNKKSEELLGITQDQLYNRSWKEFFSPLLDIDLTELASGDSTTAKFTKNLNGRALVINIKEFTSRQNELFFILTVSDQTENYRTKEELQVTLSEFKSLFKYNPNLVYSVDMDGRFTNVNDAGLKLLCYTYEEIVGMLFEKIIVKEYLDVTFSYYAKVLNGNFQRYTIQIQDKQNRQFFVEVTAVPIIIDGEVRGVIGIAQDISSRRETEQKLRESEESHRALFEHNVDPVITYDLEGRFLTFNKATEEILGASPEELIGVPFIPFIDEELQEETSRNFQRVLKGHPVQYETALASEDSEKIYLHITLIPAYISGELKYIHCIGKDITYRKKHDEMMEYMAYHDSLTGLGNQRLFHEEFRQMIQDNQDEELALWIIDLDHFKFINDSLGHEAGDRYLSTLARRLKEVVGDAGKVYRYGGDEFMIITHNTNELKTTLLASHLEHELSKPLNVDGLSSVLTASIGISFYPRHGENEKELVRAADHAMYHAKKNGRDTIQMYNSNIEGLANSDLKMESLLRNALDENEFMLYYQPQFDVETEDLCGFEALIRWQSKELGMVSPTRFIPLAEENGLIVPIGQWVLEEACRQNVELQKQGFPSVPVSVNLSLRQFYQTNIVETIDQIIKKTGICPEHLMLEITETIAMQENVAIDVLDRLKSLGVLIAMDDFGTGYSSLKYLQNFSIDHIKIDKAFIDKLDTKQGKAIISAIIALGHNLDMKVVAEGVETPHQVKILRDLDCDIFQGYYFSRPLPPQDLIQHLDL